MTPSRLDVERLKPEDVPAAARTLARAFSWHEPWGPWALPGESVREERIYEIFHRDLSGRFIDEGECWTIGGGKSVAIWFPPKSQQTSDALERRRSEEEFESFGAKADALRGGDKMISSMKPTAEHWYLDTIATEPELHGQGLGGRLLDHNLAIRDAAGDACALDTHTDENVAFYERRGFEVIAEDRLPGDGPRIIMMFRPPSA